MPFSEIPKGLSDTFKTHKDISLYFKGRYLIIYKYLPKFKSNVYLFLQELGYRLLFSLGKNLIPNRHPFQIDFDLAPMGLTSRELVYGMAEERLMLC